MKKTVIQPSELEKLVIRALERHGVTHDNASSVARALILAEIDGQPGHGLSRVPSYIGQLKSGKVDGRVSPDISQPKPAICRINAKGGFAYPAMDLLVEKLAPMARENGIAMGSVFNSHHFGQAGYHAERLADQGCIALVYSNSPKAMAPWGGREGVFGTNPIAFGAPRNDEPSLVIDLSLSTVARGKVLLAHQQGQKIPEGWARDRDGAPTTDPSLALQGTMEPAGGAKGAALALMVEILAAAVSGGNFSFEASSFFDDDGGPPSIGHTVIAIDPVAMAGPDFASRLEFLLTTIIGQDGVRLPGTRRLENRQSVAEDGLEIDANTYDNLCALADPTR